MRTVPLAVLLLASLVATGCGSTSAKKAEPCPDVVVRADRISAQIDSSSDTESNDEALPVLMGQVVMFNELVVKSPRCFDPRVVALARKALAQAKKNPSGRADVLGE